MNAYRKQKIKIIEEVFEKRHKRVYVLLSGKEKRSGKKVFDPSLVPFSMSTLSGQPSLI